MKLNAANKKTTKCKGLFYQGTAVMELATACIRYCLITLIEDGDTEIQIEEGVKKGVTIKISSSFLHSCRSFN